MPMIVCPTCSKTLPAIESGVAARCPDCGSHVAAEVSSSPAEMPSTWNAVKSSGHSTGQEAALAIRWADLLAPAQASDELGRLGPYRVLQVLGHGGMGMVFLAEDAKLKRRIALKVMLPDIARKRGTGERFLREAQAMAQVKDDHIAIIYQVDEDRDVPFLAMEFLEGVSLETKLKQSPILPTDEITRIACQIVAGLIAIHKQGLIHRDIKPANIWLESKEEGGKHKAEGGKGQDEKNADGGSPIHPSPFRLPPSKPFRVKILDFGLARSDADSSQFTENGVIVGSPAYMSPEQGCGGKVDARSDLFSLGVVLYRMFVGQVPFAGTDPVSTLLAVALEDPTPPQMLNLGMSSEMSDLILKLLAKDPQDRYQSASELAIDLGASGCFDTSSLVPARSSERGETAFSEPLSAATRPPANSRVVWLLALIGALAGVAALAWQFTLRLETSQGELVVQVNDPSIQVQVRQAGVQIDDPTTKRQFFLKPGNGEIDFLDPETGVRISTKEFTIFAGKTARVTAHLERPPAKNVAQGPEVLKALPVKVRHAVHLNGVNDRIRIPKSSFKFYGDTSLTVEVVVIPYRDSVKSQEILNDEGGSSGLSIAQLPDLKWRFGFLGLGGHVEVIHQDKVVIKRRTHLAAVFDHP